MVVEKKYYMIKNVIRVLISNIIVMITSFVNTLFIPLVLSIDAYAEYQTFMIYVSYIGLLTFGFHTGLFIKYAGKKRKEIDKAQFRSEMRFVIYSQLLIAAVVLIISCITRNELLFYFGLCILISNFVSVYKYLYQAWDEFTKFSAISIVQSLGFSGVILLVALLGKMISAQSIIYIYILVNIVCFLFVLFQYFRDVVGTKSNRIISEDNRKILQAGLLLMIGGGVNVFFSSIDKYYVKFCFSNYEFSMYCFAIALMNIMNVFISAIAQPMYLQLVSSADRTSERREYKQLLLCFGTLSGGAYYACAIIIHLFLPKYLESLKIVSILFAIFPAVAVINSLYVNLYKATDQIKRYIQTLVLMTCCAVVFNSIGVFLCKSYYSIAIATTICYYAWFVYSSRHFEGLQIEVKDIVFVIGYLLIYFGITSIGNIILGLLLYMVAIIIWDMLVYRRILKKCLWLWLKNPE